MYCRSRKSALEKGRLYYKTIKPCRRGHHSRRYTKTGRCVECDRINKLDRTASIVLRTPKWLSEKDKKEIDTLYEQCILLNKKFGDRQYHVDHQIPLNGEFVSGLHVPWNLEVIHSSDNLSKGNRL